ncbi:MAG: DUF4097 family beta strand repeat-containing protein [Acidimicrobiales bacterium]
METSVPSLRSPGQRVAIGATVLLAIALVVFGGLRAAAALTMRTATTTRTLVHPVSALVVDASDGSVTLVPGNTGEVGVPEHLRWSFSRPRPTLAWSGQTLTLDGRHCSGGGPFPVNWDCSVSYRLSVPPGISVRATTSDGQLSLSGITGPVRATTSNGSITGLGLGTNVAARTSDGAIRLSFTHPPSAVNARTSDGSVHLFLPPGPTAYRVSAATDNGSSHVGVHTDSGSANKMRVKTSDGSISFTYAGVSGH